MTTDTTTNDKCPHCGAGHVGKKTYEFRGQPAYYYHCGTTIFDSLKGVGELDGRDPLCREREARQKAEARLDLYCDLINKNDDKVIALQFRVLRLEAAITYMVKEFEAYATHNDLKGNVRAHLYHVARFGKEALNPETK